MDLNWLKNLEKQVQAATEEIEALRKENRTCRTKVKQLEQKLTDARRADQSAGDWEKERQAVRDRVEKLATSLEKLL
ncbi:MAG: cell division protein ZapB [Thermoanaerobaculia bacterium]|jgi:predicted RNase H-like nuclease (RuvC/YqgF family)